MRPARSVGWGLRGVLGAVLILCAVAQGHAQEALPVLARLGPWSDLSKLVGFQGRLWLVNSVKGVNHNSADIYSYDPRSGRLRYERHLFSQDAGDPLVADGLLYWPLEDPRISLGWGQYLVTDGRQWRLGVIPTAEIYHTHAMAELDGRLIAATSAWRAGLQVSDDGGITWRELYDHPTAARRVSRIVSLAELDGRVFGALTQPGRDGVLSTNGATVANLPGWPQGPRLAGPVAFRGRLYGLFGGPRGAALWRGDGATVERLGTPRPGWRPAALAADAEGLWAATADDRMLWRRRDGGDWRAIRLLEGGTPREILVFGGEVYVAGAGQDGRGILWGPPPPAPAGAISPPGKLPPRAPRPSRPRRAEDWEAAAESLDAALAAPDSYRGHSEPLRDLVYAMALAEPPDDFFAARFTAPMPDEILPRIGGKVQVSDATMGRWILLWGMAIAGRGYVPPSFVAEPWTAPPNPSEKYFEVAPAAMWAIAVLGQRDRTTVAALIDRLERAGDPAWLRGDVVGALTAITSQSYGYDGAAWRAWWSGAKPSWGK